MRVIAGSYRGRLLKAPKGDRARPTAARVKEALMSALQSARGSFEGAHVLDAFAGSGALGIECISRGACAAHFFEQDRLALEALRANIAALKIPSEKARVFKSDVMKNPPVFGNHSYDVVFLDPPYAYDPKAVLELACILEAAGKLSEGAVISYEHSASLDIASFLDLRGSRMDILTTKRFGGTAIDLLGFSRNECFCAP